MEGLVGLEATVFALVVPGLAAVAIVAAYLPARRALKVDPPVVLRH